MASYSSMESPSRLFKHSHQNYQVASTAPRRTIEREFSFKSPERQRLDFDMVHHRSKDHYEAKYVQKGRKVGELEHNIEAILRNNRELADQNQEMKTMLLMQRNEIQSLRTRGSRAMDLVLTQELENKSFQHRVQVEKLLSEIVRLQDKVIFIQASKDRETQIIRDQLEKMNIVNMTSVKRSQAGVAQAYQLQVIKMGELISFKEQQISKVLLTNRREKEILLDELSSVKCQFKHILALKNNQINQLKINFENDFSRIQREYRHREETQAEAHDSVIRRLGKQLAERLGDIQRLTDQIRNDTGEYDHLFKQLDAEKKKYEQELDSHIDNTREKIRHEKQKMENIIARTVENLTESSANAKKGLQDQICLLKDLLNNRRSDLETERESIKIQRDSYKGQIDDLEQENKKMREKLEESSRQNLSSIEALKVKMAQLHQADIHGLARIHETRITSICEQLAQKNRQLQEMRKRLHTEMQGKLHLRKQYEVLVAKLKSNIIDLRIQMNAVHIQMKDNITSMRSQLDVTSQGMIMDRQIKARTIKSFEDEMRKLRQTIQAKDQELRLVQENANTKVAIYKSQVDIQNQKGINLKKELEERENRKIKQIQSRDQEIIRLRKQVEELKQQLTQEQELRKSKIQQMVRANQVVEEHLAKANKLIGALKDRIASLEHDINLARGDVETVRFQQDAAANEERSKNQESISRTHSGFKEYYEKRIKQLEKDKVQLAGINTTQSQTINELVVKYKQLEDSLKVMLDSQRRLGDLENKIIHLGLDNNLVKNLAQLVKRPYI